jgi:hypothetical protein
MYFWVLWHSINTPKYNATLTSQTRTFLNNILEYFDAAILLATCNLT